MGDFIQEHVKHGILTSDKAYSEFNYLTHFEAFDEIPKEHWTYATHNRFWNCECGASILKTYDEKTEEEIEKYRQWELNREANK